MITIEFLPDQQDEMSALAKTYFGDITQVKSRAMDGSGGDFTLLVSTAALLIPAIKTVLTEHIRARRYKSFSYKGIKYKGGSPDEIAKIIAILNHNEK